MHLISSCFGEKTNGFTSGLKGTVDFKGINREETRREGHRIVHLNTVVFIH